MPCKPAFQFSRSLWSESYLSVSPYSTGNGWGFLQELRSQRLGCGRLPLPPSRVLRVAVIFIKHPPL